ncbi:hypothetical protein E2C01_080819 [Portunus trituberculatus]|uniref:Uncharacterized protein n=1 Tax=Portunus trituberculatus TaxID=210409 RepID=A0A5B7IX27_PORTR|nr:hypothetical protein [Portunus trituberculatus]
MMGDRGSHAEPHPNAPNSPVTDKSMAVDQKKNTSGTSPGQATVILALRDPPPTSPRRPAAQITADRMLVLQSAARSGTADGSERGHKGGCRAAGGGMRPGHRGTTIDPSPVTLLLAGLVLALASLASVSLPLPPLHYPSIQAYLLFIPLPK